jgi:hypothetical protein
MIRVPRLASPRGQVFTIERSNIENRAGAMWFVGVGHHGRESFGRVMPGGLCDPTLTRLRDLASFPACRCLDLSEIATSRDPRYRRRLGSYFRNKM